MEEQEAKRLSLQLMDASWVAYLTTIDAHGFPQTRAVDNLRSKERFPRLATLFQRHDDDLRVLVSTNTSSTKVTHLRTNPKVAVYYCAPREFRGLMLGGLMTAVTDPGLKSAVWHDYWVKYYPRGVTDPDYTLLHLDPSEAKYYHRLQKCTFHLKGNP